MRSSIFIASLNDDLILDLVNHPVRLQNSFIFLINTQVIIDLKHMRLTSRSSIVLELEVRSLFYSHFTNNSRRT